METFRAPKAVQAEARAAGSTIDDGGISAAEVLALDTFGPATADWQARIHSLIAARAALITPEVTDMADATTTEPTEVAPALYGLDADVLADKVGAVDAAIDAAQTLLEALEDSNPAIQQAYWLLVAADSALDDVMEACGLVDADDEMNEGEPAVGDAADMADDYEMAGRSAVIEAAEKRTVTTELRLTGTGTRIGGYAAKFNVEASGLPFREMIAPGAFRRSLQSGQDVFLLVNHDTSAIPLARRSAGTLAVSEDNVGLWIEADLDPANPDAASLLSALKRGDVDKMSFAFSVAPDWQRKADGLRTLTDLDLHEVSVVTWPAYNDTTVGMRSESSDDELALRRRRLALKYAHVA